MSAMSATSKTAAGKATERTGATANPVEMIRRSRQYLGEVRNEFSKVTWPSQKEYVGGTVGVLVVVAVMTIVLGVIDFALNQVMRLVIP